MNARARVIGLTLALGGLMVTIDTTVALVALPAIVAGLDSTLPGAQWVTTGYLLGVVGVIPVAGWAANRFGAKHVYVTALVVFTLASALAGLAWDITSLIAFRVLQGIGGGLLNPVGQAIGLRSVKRADRGRLMSLLGLPVVIGPVLGPPLAGFLVDQASWRWIFLINAPIGLIAVLVCLAVLPRRQVESAARPLDWKGLTQLSAGSVLLVLGCTRLGQSGRIDWTVLAPIGAGLLLGVGFVRRALHREAPLVDVRLLGHRPLAAGSLVLAAFGAAYFGAGVLLPVFVQAVRGDTASVAGTLTIAQALGVGLTLQTATRLVDRVRPQRIVLIGVSTGLAGAILLLASTASNAPYPLIAAAATVLGIGSGATLMPTMTYALRDLENADTPAGTTLLALVQQLASGVGVAMTASVLTLMVQSRVPDIAAGGGLQAMLGLEDNRRLALLPDLATAVGMTYGVTAVLILLALVAAAIGMRQPTDQQPSLDGAHSRNPMAR